MPADAIELKYRERTLFQFANFVNSVCYTIHSQPGSTNQVARRLPTFCAEVLPFETRIGSQLHTGHPFLKTTKAAPRQRRVRRKKSQRRDITTV